MIFFKKGQKLLFFSDRKLSYSNILSIFFKRNAQVTFPETSSIFALNQIKNILPLNIRLLVYNALVRPHIEYGIITWGGVKNAKLQKIKSLQKKKQLEHI